MLNMMQIVTEFSMLGYIEAASFLFIFYYIFSKTSAPALVGNYLPNVSLILPANFAASLNKLQYVSYKIINTIRNGDFWIMVNRKMESKAYKTLAHGIGTQNMLELTPHAKHMSYRSYFDWGTYMPFVAQSLRSKKFTYPQVADRVRKDNTLTIAIKQSAERALRDKNACTTTELPTTSSNSAAIIKTDTENDEYQSVLKQQERRGLAILKDMRSTLNNFLLALTSWLLYKLLPCFLSGVVIHTQQIEMLKKVSERHPGVPLIFLPLHRSHLDYIMVTFILTNNDIRSPLVAAGNNLQIPVFGGLLRGLGAFFIKRKIDPVVGKKDILYRAVLQLYVQHALRLGHNIEFFIEGGRTRTGKPCMPKGGILSVIVDAFMDRSIPDALLVPVSVNYERLVDGNFVREQTGEKKMPETFMKAMSGIWKALNSNYGLMRIDFNEPYSIRNLVNTYKKNVDQEAADNTYPATARVLQHNQSTSSLYGTDVICEEHRSLVDSISRQVVYDCAAATSVMSTNALSFMLLTRYRHGATLTDMARCLDELRNTLSGNKELGFSGDSRHIINYACDLLGKGLVERVTEKNGTVVIRPIETIESFIELSYYSHTLTPHFALESILLTTFHSLLEEVSADAANVDSTNLTNTMFRVSRMKLIDTALENCDVFRYEFILNKPTQTLGQNLETALDELIMRGMLSMINENESPCSDFKTSRYRSYIEENFGDDDFENINGNDDGPLIYLDVKTIAEHHAICEVLAPCSHTYLAVAQSLTLLFNNSMLESEFIKYVIKDLREKITRKQCPYGESLSTDSVRNCLKLLEKWSVIEICNKNGLRLLCLSSAYESSKKLLEPIIQRIAVTVPNYRNSYFK